MAQRYSGGNHTMIRSNPQLPSPSARPRMVVVDTTPIQLTPNVNQQLLHPCSDFDMLFQPNDSARFPHTSPAYIQTTMSQPLANINVKHSNAPLINTVKNGKFSMPCKDNTLSQSTVHNLCKLPIKHYNHSLENNISSIHLSHIQAIFSSCHQYPDAPIPNLFSQKIQMINHKSFNRLLNFDSPIDDTIITFFYIYYVNMT
jgi:hypothetical protein